MGATLLKPLNEPEVLSETVTVMLWMPDGDDNKYGHVALQTDRYHISFWPRDAKKAFSASSFQAVPADIVFHHDLDAMRESTDGKNRREPEMFHLNLSNSKINSLYEEFLRYNDVRPSDVTLEKGEAKVEDATVHNAMRGSVYDWSRSCPTEPLSVTKFINAREVLFGTRTPMRDLFKAERMSFFGKDLACTYFVCNMLAKPHDENVAFDFQTVPQLREKLREAQGKTDVRSILVSLGINPLPQF